MTLIQPNMPAPQPVADWEAASGAISTELPPEGLRTQINGIPNLMRLVVGYRDDLDQPINIVGMGSSVSVGASLPDPATQAPSAYLTLKLKERLNRLGNLNIQHYNYGQNGTAASLAPTRYADVIAAGITPALVLLSYGMNDGASAQYHAGQTYTGVYTYLKSVINSIRRDGADVLLCTTPHPHTKRMGWAMPDGIPVSYPAAGQQIPDATATQSVIKADYLNVGVKVAASYRHYRVNEAIRRVGADMGVPVLDVERYWFKALIQYGEDQLYNTTEYVHPNLLGHQMSYHKAIDDFVNGVFHGYQHSNPSPTNLNGSIGVNTPTPSATMHVKNRAAADVIAKVESSSGNVVGQFEEDGTVTFDKGATKLKTMKMVGNNMDGTWDWMKAFNFSAGTGHTFTLSAGQMVFLMLMGEQSGVGKRFEMGYAYHNGTGVTYTSLHNNGVNVFAVSVSGNDVRMLASFNNTNLAYSQQKL